MLSDSGKLITVGRKEKVLLQGSIQHCKQKLAKVTRHTKQLCVENEESARELNELQARHKVSFCDAIVEA